MRDILKAKLRCRGYDLRDDGCLYKNGQLVARNVEVLSEGFDHISFNLDILQEGTGISSDLGIELAPPVERLWLH